MCWNDIYTVLWVSCLSVLWVVAEPSILLKRQFGFKEENYSMYNPYKKFFHKLIYCCLCSGFWIGLILTQDFHLSFIISIVSELIYKKIMR